MMTLLRTISAVLCSLFLFIFLLSAGSSPAQSSFPLATDANRVCWNRLSYGTKNFFGKVTTDVQLEILPAKTVRNVLIAVPQGGALQPADGRIYSIMVHSVVDPLFVSENDLKSRAWFVPQDASALQRTRRRQGEKKWQKTYRFSHKGVFRLKKNPKDSTEANLPPEQWTRVKEHFYPYDGNKVGCTAVLEPSTLLCLASAIDFAAQKKPVRLCVFNKKQLYEVQIRAQGLKRLEVDYTEVAEEGKARRKGKIDSIKISFKPRSLVASGKKAAPFSFMGLSGDFDIYIDKTMRIPVQVSGHIARFGQLDIKLEKVELRKKH